MEEKDVLKEEEIRELLKEVHNKEVLEKDSAISWDGKNLIIRIPQEIADYLNLTEENRFENSFQFRVEEKEGTISKTFDIIKRTKPKRKEKNKNALPTKKANKKNNASR